MFVLKHIISSTRIITYIEHIGQEEALLREVRSSRSKSHLVIYKINHGVLYKIDNHYVINICHGGGAILNSTDRVQD